MAVRQYLRILTPPKGSFFLYGVRGVGKSTWARQTFPDAHIIDLLDESRYQSFAANPALLGQELRTLPANRVVVLDEVRSEERRVGKECRSWWSTEYTKK